MSGWFRAAFTHNLCYFQFSAIRTRAILQPERLCGKSADLTLKKDHSKKKDGVAAQHCSLVASGWANLAVFPNFPFTIHPLIICISQAQPHTTRVHATLGLFAVAVHFCFYCVNTRFVNTAYRIDTVMISGWEGGQFTQLPAHAAKLLLQHAQTHEKTNKKKKVPFYVKYRTSLLRPTQQQSKAKTG